MVQVELNISKSEQDLINVIAQIVAAVKAKKSIVEIAASEAPALLGMASEFSTLGSDFVASDKVDLSFYLVKAIEKALV